MCVKVHEPKPLGDIVLIFYHLQVRVSKIEREREREREREGWGIQSAAIEGNLDNTWPAHTIIVLLK